jgi:hypothetical protein
VQNPTDFAMDSACAAGADGQAGSVANKNVGALCAGRGFGFGLSLEQGGQQREQQKLRYMGWMSFMKFDGHIGCFEWIGRSLASFECLAIFYSGPLF